MRPMIDLIADVGEGFGAYVMGDDDSLLDLVTSANIACGFHAGDPRVMERTARACAARGVAIGAHPGFPDLVGFGRRTIDMSADEVRTDTLYQIGALHAFARSAGAPLAHVTPHGRLGNLVVTDARYADAVAEAVYAFDRELIVVVQEGELARAARRLGLRVGRLGLPDRAYEDDGTLVRRTVDGAVIHDPGLVAERAVAMATSGTVISRTGRAVAVECDTILLHGDNAAAVACARAVREALDAAGVAVVPLAEVLAAGSAGVLRAG
jgi:UPF0271 protein